MLRTKEYNTLYERLINDPFYAYTAARGDLTPSALEFIEKVARCIIPSFERTKEMIQGSVAVPKYSARLTLVPPSEGVKEIDSKDVYVVHGGRFLVALICRDPWHSVSWSNCSSPCSFWGDA